MTSDNHAVYSTSSSGGGVTMDSFGYTEPMRGGRMAIYTRVPIHLDKVTNGTENNETLFINDRFDGICAVSGDITELLSDIVFRLSYYTELAYDRHIGIRVSKSDHAEYASKIVIYKNDGYTYEDLCYEIAQALHSDVVAILHRPIFGELPSSTERRDRRDYDLYD